MSPRIHSALIVVFNVVCAGGILALAWALTVPNTAGSEDWKSFAAVSMSGFAALGGVTSAWVAIRNLAAQSASAKDLERVKRLLENSIPAYGDLFASALHYYRSLAPLETGNFSFEAIEDSESRMKESERGLVFVSTEFSDAWYEYWQMVRDVKERAGQVSEAHARRELWKDVRRSLSKQLEGLQIIAKTAFAEGSL